MDVGESSLHRKPIQCTGSISYTHIWSVGFYLVSNYVNSHWLAIITFIIAVFDRSLGIKASFLLYFHSRLLNLRSCQSYLLIDMSGTINVLCSCEVADLTEGW